MIHKLSKTRNERGVALLVTLFALLLLTVVGLGMLVSTATETTINANYRDKQASLMSAMAGLQEVRDRVVPAAPSLTAPAKLPSLTSADVLYLINPKSGETVAPWDPTNRWADTELCQEGILGLSGTSGVPCTTLPSGSAWYSVVDNSQSSSAPWNFSPPLDFKWVRMTLKRNNMTPVAADGVNTNSNQVCWDGVHQIVLPNGYGPTCARYGSVITIDVPDGGTGYTSAPTVNIAAPPSGGVQAAAHANMVLLSGQQVSSITINNAGTGYTVAPTVTISGGGGAGATAYANIGLPGAPVASVGSFSAGAACYSSPPAIAFVGGGGVGASAAATLTSTNTCIQSWSVNGTCNSKKNNTVTGVSLTGGGGSGFSSTLTFDNNGAVSAITIQDPGSSYTSAPTAISNLTGCNGLTFTANLGKVVQGITLTSGGSGYTSTPAVSFATGAGTGVAQPSATATLGSITGVGTITSIVVTSPGSGYTSTPLVTFAATNGTGAAATAVLTPTGTPIYKVGSVTIDNQGYGYTTDPAVTFSGGGPGSGATAIATLGRGANYGKIYLLTTLAETNTGSRTLLQMEMTTPVTGYSPAAALIVDGPNPVLQNLPTSQQFYIDGSDANTCGETPEITHPAIGGYDDPNASPATTSVPDILAALPRPDHYVGEGGWPSVKNVFGGLGETLGTPTGLKSMIDAVQAVKTNAGNTVSLGAANNPAINYIQGDLTLNGNADGYGVLVVTGTLVFGGDFNWHGVVLVVGDGHMDFGGGGNGTIYGSVIVAKIWDNYTNQNLLAANGSPTINWNGGGGNGIYYDHCWATNMMSKIPYDAPPSTKPLKILSLRSLPY